MKVEILDWDSNFFGYSVGKISVDNEVILDKSIIDGISAKLIYIFSQQPLTKEQIKSTTAKLVDTKLLFVKAVENQLKQYHFITELSELGMDLINLAIQSGMHSRFNVDKNFRNNEFERMYNSWITKSILSDDIKVYGYTHQNKLAGFITLSSKYNAADIGLIAVDQNLRGQNIGSKLLVMSDIYAEQKGLQEISVNTQLKNYLAVRFYLKNGFKIKNQTYIYHVWKQ